MSKLTLSVDNQIVDQAKKLAHDNNTSVSAMFARFIQSVSTRDSQTIKPGPLTRKATGAVSVGSEDYKDLITDALTKKYGLTE